MNLEVYKLDGIPRLKLGESPLWDERTQTFFCVDILENQLWIYDWKKQSANVFKAPGPCSYVGLTDNERRVLVAAGSSLYRLDTKTENWTLIYSFPKFRFSKGQRLNEGYVADDKTLWIGSIDFKAFDACLWNFDLQSERILQCVEGLGITNGMCEKDHKFFVTDSRRKGLSPVTKETRDLAHVEAAISFDNGEPDGCLLDVNNKVCSAIWDGSRIEMKNFSDELVMAQKLPVLRPTSLTSIDTSTLVITSASVGLSRPSPLDGHVLLLKGTEQLKFKKNNYLRIR